MTYEEGFKLFDDTYLCLFDERLVVVKVDEQGEIVKVTIFGEEKGERS